ncbi:hypothetical protein XMIN_3932 [Xanthomonas citri pv. mangiferaeindicae LMG 941]|nr:hypothetical protein Xcnt_14685 [Xanthomonas campestris pv. centellae]CCG38939.1 hypothetical protein XMIN_3932 [Xanthomonas citri pv. mangiferaeindicae LMG 941]
MRCRWFRHRAEKNAAGNRSVLAFLRSDCGLQWRVNKAWALIDAMHLASRAARAPLTANPPGSALWRAD